MMTGVSTLLGYMKRLVFSMRAPLFSTLDNVRYVLHLRNRPPRCCASKSTCLYALFASSMQLVRPRPMRVYIAAIANMCHRATLTSRQLHPDERNEPFQLMRSTINGSFPLGHGLIGTYPLEWMYMSTDCRAGRWLLAAASWYSRCKVYLGSDSLPLDTL